MSDILTMDQILSADDLKKELVEVPEWGGHVYIKALTGKERDKMEAAVITGPGERNFSNIRAKLVSLSVVDEEGVRLFTFEDAEKLGDKSAAVLDRLFAVAQKLSGMTKKDIDELAKKLEPAQAKDSISD